MYPPPFCSCCALYVYRINPLIAKMERDAIDRNSNINPEFKFLGEIFNIDSGRSLSSTYK